MSLSFFWSRSFLLNRPFLWLLFIINLLGTGYGYIWYGNQLIDTVSEHPLWRIVFVPDSPTASLFFTVALLYLLFPPRRAQSKIGAGLRAIIEALAVVTSIKYGIWAVAMIFAGAWKGNPLHWQDWMLVASHLGMAVEALLFVRFFTFGRIALIAATGWLLLNDTMDYQLGLFPRLPRVLHDDLKAIELFTYSLSLFSMLLSWLMLLKGRRTGK
ncbi:DUF1405 domain-containing protein [Paenibacillaceae bacterium]|nr:DUF1405 domain-containing protein [Paenibacillaceae bacterium]